MKFLDFLSSYSSNVIATLTLFVKEKYTKLIGEFVDMGCAEPETPYTALTNCNDFISKEIRIYKKITDAKVCSA